jgi:uncharacterized protein (TIGR02284 family)
MTTDAQYTDAKNMSNDDIISTLNGLIETCKDGQEGFQQAAEGIERTDLKSLFFEFSQQRAHFAGELQSMVQQLGGDPKTSGSLSGSMHRGWMDLKTALTGKDEYAVLKECERGEDSAKNAYQEALEEPLPTYILETVRNECDSVIMAHDRIRALRDSFKNVDDARSNRATTR